jgi:hypothetical protein
MSKKRANLILQKLFYVLFKRAHLCVPKNKTCEMGSSFSKTTSDIACHSPFKIKEQLPNGKYLDILLRCLQLLTLSSISFQAWAILYKHITYTATEAKKI